MPERENPDIKKYEQLAIGTPITPRPRKPIFKLFASLLAAPFASNVLFAAILTTLMAVAGVVMQ